MKKIINGLLAKTGYRIVQDSPLLFHGKELNRLYREAPWINYWLDLSERERREISPFLWSSQAQLGQDLFAWTQYNKNATCRTPYFVDIGASDGVRFSNSFMLEQQFGWQGIAVEPAQCWEASLRKNRSCAIDTRAIFSVSGQSLTFLDVSNRVGYRELSSLATVSNSDERAHIRKGDPATYQVETISFNDLLSVYNAPSFIDFLSIDTEGSELAILESFDFDNYKIGSACIEHNYNKANRQAIFSLFVSHGYVRVHEKASAWDDWYVLADQHDR